MIRLFSWIQRKVHRQRCRCRVAFGSMCVRRRCKMWPVSRDKCWNCTFVHGAQHMEMFLLNWKTTFWTSRDANGGKQSRSEKRIVALSAREMVSQEETHTVCGGARVFIASFSLRAIKYRIKCYGRIAHRSWSRSSDYTVSRFLQRAATWA